MDNLTAFFVQYGEVITIAVAIVLFIAFLAMMFDIAAGIRDLIKGL